MPTNYLIKAHKDTGIPMTELEVYWEKAKGIADSNPNAVGEKYWPYVMGIFKNMIRGR